jgi:hypothetical protein
VIASRDNFIRFFEGEVLVHETLLDSCVVHLQLIRENMFAYVTDAGGFGVYQGNKLMYRCERDDVTFLRTTQENLFLFTKSGKVLEYATTSDKILFEKEVFESHNVLFAHVFLQSIICLSSLGICNLKRNLLTSETYSISER